MMDRGTKRKGFFDVLHSIRNCILSCSNTSTSMVDLDCFAGTCFETRWSGKAFTLQRRAI